jgi:hypothetical protein
MHTHNGTLYPMLGVGAFMAMFWTGIVLGHELGLGCISMLMTGLLCASIATVGVCELQRRDAHGLAAEERVDASRHGGLLAERPVSPQPAREATEARRSTVLGIGARPPLESC